MNRSELTIYLFLIIILVFIPGFATAADEDAAVFKNPAYSLTPAESEWLEKHDTVRVRVSSWYPPFIFYENGRPKGMAYDYMKIVLNHLGLEMVPVFVPSFSKALEKMKKGKEIDIQPVLVRTAKRQQFLLFTRDYLTFPLVIFNRTQSEFISDMDNLKGKTVAVERDYIYKVWLKTDYPEIGLLETDKTEEALKAVSMGKADAYMGNLAVGSYFIQHRGLVNLKVAAPAPYGPARLSMGIRKDLPELASLIDKSLGLLSPEDHTRIRQKWLSVRYEHGIRQSDLLWWILIVASAALVVIMVIYFSNLRLKKEIRDRQIMERRLVKSEKKYRELYEGSRDGYAMADEKGFLTEFNSTFQQMLGYTPDELKNKTYKDITPENWHEAERQIIEQQVMKRGYSDIYEKEYIKKDGTRFPVEMRAYLFESLEDEPAQLWAFTRDVSDRKQNELQLKQSEERYRSLVENTQDGYFIYNIHNQKFLFLNQRICELFGYTPEEGLQLRVWDIMHPEAIEAAKKRIEDRLKNNDSSPQVNVYKVIRKNGTHFRAEISSSMVMYKNISAMQGTLRDITEKERLQKQLWRAQKLESIGTLAGGVAHDFNNLLMAIQGNVSLILFADNQDEKVVEKLKNIEQLIVKATKLTGQLLGFARIGKYETRPTDINELIEKSATLFQRTKKEIKLHTLFKISPATALVDSNQIEQVLLNLYVNAWQAMKEGGNIYVETDILFLDETRLAPYKLSPGSYVKISVTDTGVGMDKKTLERIFDPFFTTKARGHGTGLGLASAYGIVKNHNGFLDVYSEPGSGSTFNVYLPATDRKPLNIPGRKNIIRSGNETILLIDDEKIIVDIGRELLNKLGYRVMTALDGKQAINIYRESQNQIDLVILDMIMPDMGGREIFDRLKQLNPEIRVLLSSGYSKNRQAEEILDRGCNGFIQKPFSIEQLSEKIREILAEK